MLKRLSAFIIVLLFTLTPVIAQRFSTETIQVEGVPAYDLEVSPDGRIAALYTGAMTRALLGIPLLEYSVEPMLLPVRLIDLNTGESLTLLFGATDYVGDVAFSPDGKLIAVYYLNGEIYLWDLETYSLQTKITAILGNTTIQFLPDNKTLVVLYRDQSVNFFLLWDTETGQVTDVWRRPMSSFGELKLADAMGRFNYSYLAFDLSPNGKWLATATFNGEVTLWDTETFEQHIIRVPDEQPGRLSVRTLHFTDDGSTLVYFDQVTEQTHFWEVEGHSEKAAVNAGAHFFALSPDGEILAWVTREGIWFTTLAEPDNVTQVLLDSSDEYLFNFNTAPVFTPDNRLVIGGFYNTGGTSTILPVVNFSD